MTTFGLVTVALMKPGLDDPKVRTGWIGIVLFVLTLIFVIGFGIYSAKVNGRTRQAAASKEGEESPLMEKSVAAEKEVEKEKQEA